MGRKLFGLIAPVIVVALAFLIDLMFTAVAGEGTAAADYAIVYALALLSPMGLTALAGYLCALSTRGRPTPRLGKLSSIINLVLTAILIVPALIMLPLFLDTASTMIPDLISWLRPVPHG